MRVLISIIVTTTVVAAGGVLAAQGAGQHGHGHTAGGVRDHHGEQAAIGRPGDPQAATRTIEVVLEDIKFSPPEITVRDGETVRFVLRNRGKLLHEFNVGTPPMHRAHQAEMQKMFEQGLMTPTSMAGHMAKDMPGHGRGHMDEKSHGQMMGQMHGQGGSDGSQESEGMAHDDPNSVLLEPGETKELVWTFRKTQDLEFACNVPGHYPAGMVGNFKFN